MKTIIYTRLFALVCVITIMTGISAVTTFDTKETIENLSKICEQELDEIPNWQTIQDVIEQLDIEEIRNIRKKTCNIQLYYRFKIY